MVHSKCAHSVSSMLYRVILNFRESIHNSDIAWLFQRNRIDHPFLTSFASSSVLTHSQPAANKRQPLFMNSIKHKNTISKEKKIDVRPNQNEMCQPTAIASVLFRFCFYWLNHTSVFSGFNSFNKTKKVKFIDKTPNDHIAPSCNSNFYFEWDARIISA